MTQVESGQGMSQTTKIALGALAVLVMAAGLWWYFTNIRVTEPTVEPVLVDPAPSQEVVTAPSEVTPMPSLENDSVDLATTGQNTGTGIGTNSASAISVGGINPDTPLAGVPSKNPFSPLRLEGTDDAFGSMSGSAPNDPPPSNDFTPSNTTGFVDDTPSFTSSAPVAIPSRGSSSTTSGRQSSWDFGDTSPPSASPSTPASSGTQISGGTSSWDFDDGAPSASRPSSGSADSTDWKFNDPASAATGSGAGRPSAPSASASSASTPAVVAGLGKRQQQLPNSLGGAGSSTGTVLAAGRPSSADLKTDRNGLPSYVQQYGAVSVAAPDDGTLLSRTLNTKDYRFTGSVIGPNSTAIFKSVQGFDVVEEGDTLPGTNVLVRKIEKQRVTLALGSETVTLDLESLAKF